MSKRYIFKTNPQKSANLVTINSFMMGSLFFILTLIITLDPNKFSKYAIYELVLAIPLLYVSSLAYSKIGYSEETPAWDTFGWLTHTTGNSFVLNAVGLVASKFNQSLAYVYFAILLFLMIIYTITNIKHRKELWIQKIFKLFFLVVIIIWGGMLLVQ